MPSKREALDDIGRQAVASIRRSKWPVRTGRSKRGFGYVLAGDSMQITNREDYADDVEERTGIAEQAVRDTQFTGDEVAQWLESQFE